MINNFKNIENILKNLDNLFNKGKEGTKLERLLTQISMIFNRQGDEGGLYIFLGQKKD